MWGKRNIPPVPIYFNCEACRWEYEVHHGHRYRLVMCEQCSWLADLPYLVQDHYFIYLECEEHSDEEELEARND